ncbi:lipopolysaccharide transport periplasmic protein LptA [Thermomonas sp.]|uniref:lipopolysaccharide transport periplasmic protein LptA n=1 Tax=Thermomonas sp. TaxID=1971895 RepID=UPI002486CF6B|nr:lipopolysaccharide transport periplasmic protein LptA [Thermomonas sp.]MDI1251894.1 lipopolysaccharide transport periplasmic protein LptA [Thermomonas sp.]
MSLRPIDFAATAVAVLAAVFAAGASARTSDRNQPMHIGADLGTLSMSGNGQTVLTGNVTINQGSLNVLAAKAVIDQGDGDINRAQMSGGVTLKQQLDDGSPIHVTSSNVDYNLKTEVVIFTGNVVITQPRGTLNGQRVVYSMKTGQVESGGSGNGRVKMTILPKSAQGKSAQAAPKPTAPASESKP